MMKAFGNNIILEPILKEEPKGGIIIAFEEDEKQEQGRGKVLSFGQDVKGLKEGQIVYFRKCFEEELDDYWVIKQEHIIAYE